MRKTPTGVASLGRAAYVAIASIGFIGCRGDSPVAPASSDPTTAPLSASRQATTSGRIVFVREVGTDFHLFTMDDDGTDVFRVTGAFLSAVSGSWAPDGKRIVASAMMASDVDLSLFSMNPDGTGITRLTAPPAGCHDHYPATVGKRIAFLRACNLIGALMIMNEDGTGLTPLVDDILGAIGPSPRGDAIAYSRNGDIWLVDVATGGTVRLTNTPAFESQPTFSPGGKRIAFSVNELGSVRIFTMNPDGTMLTLVADHAHAPAWSPDGKRIAFTSETIGDVFVMNADGTAATNLTQTSVFEAPTAWTRY